MTRSRGLRQLLGVAQGHRRAGKQAQHLAAVAQHDPGALDEPVRRRRGRHVDLEQLTAHLDAEAQPLPLGGQPRVES